VIAALRRRLADPALPARLQALAGGAPASAPLSLTVELAPGITDWLAALPASGPFWYQARPAQELFRLGIGHALHVGSAGPNRFAALDNAFAGIAGAWRHNAPPLAFCGFAFDEQNQTPLANALLAIPAIVLEAYQGRCRAILSTTAEKIPQAVAGWQKLLASPARHANYRLLPARAHALPDRAWIARVRAALRDIDSGQVDKIVLARSHHLEADAPIPASHLLGALIEQQPDAMIYACGNGPNTFLGATPERLVRLAGRQLEADALAGTAWPGSLALDAPKNRHEQALVTQAIVAALAKCCVALPRPGPVGIHAAGQISHLRSRITGIIAPGITIFDLIRALHPTPAVGGFPGAAAASWLARHGEARSGWYSGGFGTLGADGDGEFNVALRSALIDGKRIELHAGAGIVAGSDPEHELAETEAKIGTLLAALRAEPAQGASARA
jgi:salicylate biosynthesis isochorismate synthase